MNRWRQRLAELHGDSSEPAALPCAVQNVQNLQNSAPHPAFEHFEQFEHWKEPPERPVSVVPPPPDRVPSRWGEAEAERAAIVEHDGKIPHAWAEGFARLDPDRPPKGLSPKRWLQFINDIGRFLDSPFCAVAAALGWTAFDLFGADRDRPFARIDHAGLLWLLNGNRLAIFAKNTATIETRTGARQTYRLKPSAPGRVLAWELVDAEPP